MAVKLRVLPVEQACECPFYLMNQKGSRHCFIKQAVSFPVACSLLEDEGGERSEGWEGDCGGTWERCTVLPLLYEFKASASVPLDTGIEDYSPFDEEAPDEPVMPGPVAAVVAESFDGRMDISDLKMPHQNPAAFIQEEAAQKVVEAALAAPELPDVQQETLIEPPRVKVNVRRVDNPYRVKVDVLIYPTNTALLIDDPLLQRMSRNNLQEECDRYGGSVPLGQVFVTSNGGDHAGGVVPKRIFHAVVAVTTKLVRENAIRNAVLRALMRAEMEGAESVAMLPADCGTHDIEQVAMVQLAAIQDFLYKTKPAHLKRIHVVMEDEESEAVFKFYYDRVFNKSSRAQV